MTIVVPADAPEMERAMDASLEIPGPVYVRIAKGGDPVSSRADLPFAIGSAISLRAGYDVLFVGTGIMTTSALRAAESLEADGIVVRTVYAQVPPKVEYRLTDWGQSLCPALDALLKWKDRRNL